MGTCCSIKQEIRFLNRELKLPCMYFVLQNKRRVISIEDGIVKKVKISGLKLFSDSVVGNLDDESILLVGGIKSNCRATKQVFQVFPSTRTFKRWPSLSFPVTKGHICQIPDQIFLASSDLTIEHQIYSTGIWRPINCGTQRIISSTIVNHNNMLYFLCGKKINYKFTKKVFLMDPLSPSYTLSKMKMKIKLNKPIGVSAFGAIILVGGERENGCYNSNAFVWIKEEWRESAGPDTVLEDYPGIVFDEICVFLCKLGRVVTLDSNFRVRVMENRKEFKVKENKTEKGEKKENGGQKLKVSDYKINRFRRNSKELNEILNNCFSERGALVPDRKDAIEDEYNSRSARERSASPRSMRSHRSFVLQVKSHNDIMEGIKSQTSPLLSINSYLSPDGNHF